MSDTGGSSYRRSGRRRRPPVLVVDFRGYHRRRGQFLLAERVLVGGRWTPLVRLRARRPRASDGATEW